MNETLSTVQPPEASSSPLLFRGEPDGKLREHGNWLRPWFFAECLVHAERYAGLGTEPVVCRVVAEKVLDLTDLDALSLETRLTIEAYAAEFDDWTCRYSGEPRDVWSFLEGGDLYDYEGTGSGHRWYALFRWMLDSHDAVRVLDRTDGNDGQAVPVWVVSRRDVIALLPPEEAQRAREQARSQAETELACDRPR